MVPHILTVVGGEFQVFVVDGPRTLGGWPDPPLLGQSCVDSELNSFSRILSTVVLARAGEIPSFASSSYSLPADLPDLSQLLNMALLLCVLREPTDLVSLPNKATDRDDISNRKPKIRHANILPLTWKWRPGNLGSLDYCDDPEVEFHVLTRLRPNTNSSPGLVVSSSRAAYKYLVVSVLRHNSLGS